MLAEFWGTLLGTQSLEFASWNQGLHSFASKRTLVHLAANGRYEPKLTDAAARTNGGLPIGACTHGDIVFSAVQATAQDAEALDVREGSSFFKIDHLT